MDSTEHEKSPHIFCSPRSQRSEPLLWVKHPFVCLPEVLFSQNIISRKEPNAITSAILSALVGRDIIRFNCIRAFKPLQKEKRKLRQKVCFIILIIISIKCGNLFLNN